MKIEKIPFGNYQGEPVALYVLENDKGMLVKIMNYGATITSIQLPNEDGTRTEVVCGFDNFEGYLSQDYQNNAPYFGCTVGRYAGRIKNGRFSINGSSYNLAKNNGTNHLHGGIVGFDKKIWEVETIEQPEAFGVTMSLFSPDMEEGFPGNLHVSVTFLLNNNNEVSIHYEGTTDKATPLSLTNHTYFNLSGFTENILTHKAIIEADHLLVPDETNVPDGTLASVENTAADLINGVMLGKAISQLETGFEHYYVFNSQGEILTEAASFDHLKTGRKLKVYTSEPGMLFYTGYFTCNKLSRENGDAYGRYMAFCCETSRYPNGPNIAGSPGSITTPDSPYSSSTVFTFKNAQS